MKCHNCVKTFVDNTPDNELLANLDNTLSVNEAVTQVNGSLYCLMCFTGSFGSPDRYRRFQTQTV